MQPECAGCAVEGHHQVGAHVHTSEVACAAASSARTTWRSIARCMCRAGPAPVGYEALQHGQENHREKPRAEGEGVACAPQRGRGKHEERTPAKE